MAKSRHLLAAAVVLTAASAGALTTGVYVLSRDPNFFTAVSRVTIGPSPLELTANRIAHMLSDGAADAVTKQIRVESTKAVYATRNNLAIWSGSPIALQKTAQVIAILQHAGDDALDPTDYRIAEIAKLTPDSPEDAAAFDLLLTDAVLRYAADMQFGREKAKAVDRDIDVPEEALDLPKALADAVAAGTIEDFLNGLQPKAPEYQALKQAFLRYRTAAGTGGWPDVSPRTRLAELRPRLAVEDPSLSAAPQEDNRDVREALKRYQTRNRLRADGRLNAETVRSLNVAMSRRAAQVAANMERWRWYPSELGPNRIVVNVTEAEAKAFHNGKNILTSRVVVGDQDTRTPVLRAVAKAVLVNPPWNVPQSIIRKEILPKLRNNPGYLASQSMRVRGSGRMLRLQQTPGPRNALGTLKFEMPNKFNVYLHDTPAKSAFARGDRTMSHGCVRVQQILPLGSVALTGDPDAGIARIKSLIPSRKTRTLTLPEPLPVYIAYWTAIPDENGAIAFRPDVYGRDKRMIAALDGFHVNAAPAEARMSGN